MMVKRQEKMRLKKKKTQIFRLIFAAWWWCWQHNSRVAVCGVGSWRQTSVRPCEIWENDVERLKNDTEETEFPMERRGMGQTIKSDEIKRYKGENTSILCI
jgi:hypothetical protein